MDRRKRGSETGRYFNKRRRDNLSSQQIEHEERKRKVREEYLENCPDRGGPWKNIGKDVKVVQCWRCKEYGHRSGDGECPAYTQRNKSNLSTEIFRFEHEDPMHKYFEERKRREKEERVEQLKQLLEDSDSESSSDEDSKKKKRRTNKKDRKKDAKSTKAKLKSKQNQKKLSKKKSVKKHKKKGLKESVAIKQESDIRGTSNCDRNKDNTLLGANTFGPSPPSNSDSDKNCRVVAGSDKSCVVSGAVSNKDNSNLPMICQFDLQRELRRFREESEKVKKEIKVESVTVANQSHDKTP